MVALCAIESGAVHGRPPASLEIPRPAWRGFPERIDFAQPCATCLPSLTTKYSEPAASSA